MWENSPELVEEGLLVLQAVLKKLLWQNASWILYRLKTKKRGHRTLI